MMTYINASYKVIWKKKSQMIYLASPNGYLVKIKDGSINFPSISILSGYLAKMPHENTTALT